MLHEKGLDFECHDVDPHAPPEHLGLLNPQNEAPVLIDGDVVLAEAFIITEYLDERSPPPRLMPEAVGQRARMRFHLYGLERDLFGPVRALERTPRVSERTRDEARKQIVESLTTLSLILRKHRLLSGEHLSMPDVLLAPLLWRLDAYGISLPQSAAPLKGYCERVFARPAFVKSLSPSEKKMRR